MKKICTKCGKEKDLSEYSFTNKTLGKRRASCKECMRKINNKNSNEYYGKHRNEILEYQKDYVSNNRTKVSEYKKSYHQERFKDICYRLLHNYKARFSIALKTIAGIEPAQDIVGCSPGKLKNHLESQFRDGMSWDNYGHKGWHIDHIRPCASFDLTDPEQQRQCFHYSNLQPLWWYENMQKRKTDNMIYKVAK